MIKASKFDNVRDNLPKNVSFESFNQLVDKMVAEIVTASPSDKVNQVCISPALYENGTRRAKKNAISWNWFAADIDNKDSNIVGSRIQDVQNIMKKAQCPYFIYTTASHTEDSHRFRLMFPIDRAVSSVEFEMVWHSFNRMLPMMDAQTKDISRLFIVPRHWVGRTFQSERELNGQPIKVDDLLVRYPPPPVSVPTPKTTIAATPRHTPTERVKPAEVAALRAPYVPAGAVEEAMSASPGGRMYRFLLKVAHNANDLGYGLDVSELQHLGEGLAALMKRHTDDIAHDAKNALNTANQKQADKLAKLQEARSSWFDINERN